jgi:hypothetical protein
MREVWDTQADIREQPGEGKKPETPKIFSNSIFGLPLSLTKKCFARGVEVNKQVLL